MKRILWASIIASCLVSAPAFARPHSNHRRPSQRLAEGEHCNTPKPTPTCTQTPQNEDECPSDPNKTKPGVCGCGYPDTDTDGDGTPDCLDYCPDDPNKTRVGKCGCGVSDDTPNCDEPCVVDDDCETPTPTPTCTTTPTQTPTCTPTATPTATPTPEPSCEFYKGSINKINNKRSDYNSQIGHSLSDEQSIQRDEATKGLACLNQAINDITSKCYKYYRYFDKNTVYHDDCVAVGITKKFFIENNSRTSCKSWDSDGSHVGDHVFGDTANLSNKVRGFSELCLDGEFYFDEGCNAVPAKDYENLCGEMSVQFKWSCPVSLLWEQDYNVNSNATLAEFNLDPSNNTPWTVWKASDKAPLLVFDPEHKGVVTDASQLFGNWTFGGKRSAALASDASSVAAGKWENGYEALASLDADGNGKVDGAELDDLALWFDANQNAVSEAGEVKSLKDAGVTAVFVKGYTKDALSDDLRMEIGYERTVNGRTVQGPSVDWYGAGAESKMDLANFYSYLREGMSADEAPLLANTSAASKFTGAWKWYLTDDAQNADVQDGLLVLSDNSEDNSVKGYTFTEKALIRSPKNAMKAVGSLHRVIGSRSVKDGRDVLTFSASSKNMSTKSEAELSADGQELTGKTTVTVANGAEVLSYSWKAFRAE